MHFIQGEPREMDIQKIGSERLSNVEANFRKRHARENGHHLSGIIFRF